MFFKLGQRNQGSDSQAALSVLVNAIESANAFQVNYARGPRDVILHGGQKILAAGDGSGSFVDVCQPWCGSQRGDCFPETSRTHPLKRFHASLLSPISPDRILSGVIGSSRTRTPQALKTALAKAPREG